MNKVNVLIPVLLTLGATGCSNAIVWNVDENASATVKETPAYKLEVDNCSSATEYTALASSTQPFKKQILLNDTASDPLDYIDVKKSVNRYYGEDIIQAFGQTQTPNVTVPAGERHIITLQWQDEWQNGEIVSNDNSYQAKYSILNNKTLAVVNQQTKSCTGENEKYAAVINDLAYVGPNPGAVHFGFNLTEVDPNAKYFLNTRVVNAGCGDSGLKIDIATPNTSEKILTLDQFDMPCLRRDQFPEPITGITYSDETVVFAWENSRGLIKQDITELVNEIGDYSVQWRHQKGCCGPFIAGMALEVEE